MVRVRGDRVSEAQWAGDRIRGRGKGATVSPDF